VGATGLGPPAVRQGRDVGQGTATAGGLDEYAGGTRTTQTFRLGGGWASHPLIPCLTDPPTSFLRPTLVCTALQSRWPRGKGTSKSREALLEPSGEAVRGVQARRLLRLLCYLQLHGLSKAAVGVSAEQLYSDTLDRFRPVLRMSITEELPMWAGTTRKEAAAAAAATSRSGHAGGQGQG